MPPEWGTMRDDRCCCGPHHGRVAVLAGSGVGRIVVILAAVVFSICALTDADPVQLGRITPLPPGSTSSTPQGHLDDQRPAVACARLQVNHARRERRGFGPSSKVLSARVESDGSILINWLASASWAG